MRYDKENNWLFLHIPKTGGCTVEAWMDEMEPKPFSLPQRWKCIIGKLPGRHVLKYHLSTVSISWERIIEEVKIFCFVRHPVDWWLSTWRHFWDMTKRREQRHSNLAAVFQGFDWHPHKCLVRYLHKDFEKFVRVALTSHPGYASELFRLYCQDVDYIGRMETLRPDMTIIYGGKKFPVIQSNSSRHPKPEVSKELREWIEEKEKPAMERFYSSKTERFRWRKDWE